MSVRSVLLAALLVVASVATPAAAAVGTGSAAAQEANAYSGTHIAFAAEGDAVTDYTVGGTTMAEAVRVQSAGEAESQFGSGFSLDAVANLDGAAVGLNADARTETQARATFDSGAELTAHDNDRGIFVLHATDGEQVAEVDLGSDAEARADGDDRVVVTRNGTTGTFIVVGDGDVSVTEEGDVSATLAEDSELVFRAYEDGRDESAKRQEDLIANGTAAAEVYLTGSSEASGNASDDGQQQAVDIVNYGQDTTVEVTERSESRMSMTVERTEGQGKVVIVSGAETVADSAEDVQVTVDGEAAARASSYSELRSAANGGESAKFLVRQSANAEASGEVLVALNHFSARDVTVSDGSQSMDGNGSDDGGAESTSATSPGFGVGVSVVALAGVALLARRQ